MRKNRTNIGQTHLTAFVAIAVVVVLVIALGLHLYSESPSAEARFEVSELVIEPDAISTGENINVSVKVTNVGDSEGTYWAILKINDMGVEGEKITLTSGETKVVTFTVTIGDTNLWGVTCDVSVDELTGTFRVRDTSWWRGETAEIVNGIVNEYIEKNLLEGGYVDFIDFDGTPHENEYCTTFKKEKMLGGHFCHPYDREGDIYVVETKIKYGNDKRDPKCWRYLLRVNLDTFEVECIDMGKLY